MTSDLPNAFSNYEQIEKIGEGGFGEVFRAIDRRLDRAVALKIPHQQLALLNPAFVQQFVVEAKLAAQLDHPNIVRIYNIGEYQGTPYLEMELVEGQTLEEFIQERGRLTPEETLAILEPVCAALGEAHRLGIIHRDIKPQNILIRQTDGRVLVSDFGLAKATEDSFQASLSSSNVVVGTFRYMPPEQADPELGETGPSSDLYSLGIVLYEMLTGRVPFTSSSVGRLVHEHTSKAPEPPSNLNINISTAVESVVLKALQKRPDERFESAAQMAQAFRDALESDVIIDGVYRDEAHSAGEAAPSVQPARRNRVSIVAAAGAFIVAVLLMSILIGPRLLEDGAASPESAAAVVATGELKTESKAVAAKPSDTPTVTAQDPDTESTQIEAASDSAEAEPPPPTPAPESTETNTPTPTTELVLVPSPTPGATAVDRPEPSLDEPIATPSPAQAGSSSVSARIIVRDADATWSSEMEPDVEIESVASTALPRSMIGYANTVLALILAQPPQPAQERLSQVDDRIRTEYANSIYQNTLSAVPAELETTLQGTTTKPVIENAKSSLTIELAAPESLFYAE